ncbi:NUDIX domain-containing protein [Streptomyces sp. NBC_01020]|uniref:NUDIX domain-containing protein n=1 Tax=unclassified Streptomyces TaxID=2593676 RepID=UPI002E1CF7F9|nr:NUDIX domain-containing protein [Streptomyces sp. NBC_01020]WSX45629.1 NUDIX domain-containing protein [Streptomyces sp. NBC_00963]WSX66322.1 NUDIX domain-containing protein [Streptomyces sp. NBC_00932]
MTTLPVRPAARVIALDGDGRVLLLRYEENGGFWATPGGSLDRGEDHTAALRRELGEELGVDGDRVRLGPQLAERTSDHTVGDGDVRQIERYYIARLTEADLNWPRPRRPIPSRPPAGGRSMISTPPGRPSIRSASVT